MKDSYTLNINDVTISSENSVKLLGIEIDNRLPFEKHISTLCNKASNQHVLFTFMLRFYFLYIYILTAYCCKFWF